MQDLVVNLATRHPAAFYTGVCIMLALVVMLALWIVRLQQQLANLQAHRVIDRRKAELGFTDILLQADALRHYAQLEDTRPKTSRALPTVGEVQAGHFEDIAVRHAPEIESKLEQLRAARQAKSG